MTRSNQKGIYVDPRIIKKIVGKNPLQTDIIKTWIRASVISQRWLVLLLVFIMGRFIFPVLATEDMVGHRLSDFSLLRNL